MDDLLEDAPLWNFANLLLQQLFGWPMYILTNASGQARYPSWTNREYIYPLFHDT
jgi:omega-6 fatty acid desaturase (delta-12 desaturase)